MHFVESSGACNASGADGLVVVGTLRVMTTLSLSDLWVLQVLFGRALKGQFAGSVLVPQPFSCWHVSFLHDFELFGEREK